MKFLSGQEKFKTHSYKQGVELAFQPIARCIKNPLGSIDSFTKRGGIVLRAKPHKDLNELCAALQRELLRSEKIQIAS